MSNEGASSDEGDSLLDKDLSRRIFLAGAASQIAKHSLITVPTVALILNGAALPARTQGVYYTGPGGPKGPPPRGPGNNRGNGNN